jgi:hypothetical protein
LGKKRLNGWDLQYIKYQMLNIYIYIYIYIYKIMCLNSKQLYAWRSYRSNIMVKIVGSTSIQSDINLNKISQSAFGNLFYIATHHNISYHYSFSLLRRSSFSREKTRNRKRKGALSIFIARKEEEIPMSQSTWLQVIS